MAKNKSKSSLASNFFGLVFGITFVVSSVITTGQPKSFWNLPSFLITVGGTSAVMLTAFNSKRLKTLGPVMKKALFNEGYNVEEDIKVLVKLSEIARKEGLLALEDQVNEYTDDEFLRHGIELIVDGIDQDELRDFLEGETYFMRQRHQKGAAMVDMIASTAPALGLMGTYVGLIPMLNSLDDPTTLGPMMALELVSSFYGAFLAYVIFSPVAKRLRFMDGEETLRRELIIEGVSSIQQGKNPTLLKGELYAYAHISPPDPEKERDGRPVSSKEVVNSI